MVGFGEAFGVLLVASQVMPYLLSLLFCVALLVIARRGRGGGWRLISAAGGVLVLRQVLAAYPQYMIIVARASASELGRVLGVFNAAGALLGLIAAVLLLTGLQLVQQDGERRGPPSDGGR